MTYSVACETARLQSAEFHCVQHVNAIIAPEQFHNPVPSIVGYQVSDWTDGSTVKSYSDGREL